MHLQYHTLAKLADYIQTRMKNAIFGDCFTQEKDELIIGLATSEDELWLRVSCTHPLACIWPSDEIGKAKKNVVHLFTELMDKHLLRVETVRNERVLMLHFEEKHTLVLKMFGMQSNVLLMKDGKVTAIFRNSLKEDFNFNPQSDPAFQPNYSPEQLAALAGDQFWIYRQKDRIKFSLFPPAEGTSVAITGIEPALGFFCRTFLYFHSYIQLYRAIEKQSAKPYRKLKGQANSYRKSIVDIGAQRSAEEIGNLLMANLHLMKEGEKEIEVFDFYKNEQIRIKLNPKLSPNKNAERYFKKQKKRKGQVAHMQEFIGKLEAEAEGFHAIITEFEALTPPEDLELTPKGIPYTHMKALKAFLKAHPELDPQQQKDKKQERHAFQRFEKDSYEIYVGRSAQDNDVLIRDHARKEDLWLHARNVTGSHVIIKSKGKPFPKPVIEYAAQLAARYSKMKHDKVVPVIFTLRKFVRKPKGAYPGQVLVEKEEVVFVEPVAM